MRTLSVDTATAGKHIGDLGKKFRAFALLDTVQTDLGYHTRSGIETLRKMLDAGGSVVSN